MPYIIKRMTNLSSNSVRKNTKSFSIALLGMTLLSALFVPTAQASIKAGFAYDYGLGGTLQIDNKINLFIGNDGVTADYLFKQGRFDDVEGKPFAWYVGGGAFIGWRDDFGVRLPLGVDLSFAQDWHLYGQVSPGLNLDDRIKLGIDAAVGIRYAF